LIEEFPMASTVNQSRFLGSLLGLAMGDALGMPVSGMSSAEIRSQFGVIEGYHGRVLPDGAEVKAGEFTDESEVALCIVESLTTNQGELDPANIGARMLFLARGESRRWMPDDTLQALNLAESTLDFHVPIDEDGPATGDVASRGIPIGLLHSVGDFDAGALRADAELVTRLTHGSPAAIAGTTAVAFGVQIAARGNVRSRDWAGETATFLAAGELAERLHFADELIQRNEDLSAAQEGIGAGNATHEAVASAFLIACSFESFQDAVFAAVNAGGATDSRGAIVGALKGAVVGANGIPQGLIDDLESRIYVSLAAPWFHRIALRRMGEIIDLRPSFDAE
jgi:ADP-ribosyl-[dinitrogen reductase] hydrolase